MEKGSKSQTNRLNAKKISFSGKGENGRDGKTKKEDALPSFLGRSRGRKKEGRKAIGLLPPRFSRAGELTKQEGEEAQLISFFFPVLVLPRRMPPLPSARCLLQR